MSRRAVVLLALCALLACGRNAPPEEESPREPAARSAPDVDSDNLLNLAYGASVVSRTGEANLERSAAHAIDGLSESVWVSSPGWPKETLVYSLIAPSKIAQAGVTVIKDTEVPRRVILESSMDGKQWSELAVIEPRNVAERQLVNVPGTVLQYLRVRPQDEQYYVRLGGIHLLGEEAAPPQTPPFTGCWTINGWDAEIVQDGARITGTIHSDPPIHLDGGTDNRAAAVMWLQGAMWGYAVLSRTPDGQHLTGLRFHEEVDRYHLAEGWFGEKCRSAVRRPAGPPVSGQLFERAGRYSAFGLAFAADGRLIEELSGAALDTLVALKPRRIVAHHFYDAPEATQRITAAKLGTLRAALQARGADVARITFVPAGGSWNGPAISSPVQRFLANRVDIIPPP